MTVLPGGCPMGVYVIFSFAKLCYLSAFALEYFLLFMVVLLNLRSTWWPLWSFVGN